MTNYQWEDVEVPRGAFISWGTQTGQFVCGKVLSYDPTGGTDYNQQSCPQLAIELIEPAASINKENQRTDFPAGELVVLNCGQVSLKRAVNAASLNPGDLVKIILSNLARTPNGTVKEFELKVARGAGRMVQGSDGRTVHKAESFTAPAQPQAEPPF